MWTQPDPTDDPGPAIFAVVDIGTTVADDHTSHPTVVIDAAGRPDVTDLARVHALDGIGDVNTVAMRSGRALLLGIRLSSPVRAAFAIVFDLDRHGEFLVVVADAGSLTIATTDPVEAGVDRPLWLAVDIDGPALRRMIETADR
jgi:hypothetical protein